MAPKRRKEAEQIPDSELIDWLAADGGRLRRPIIVSGKQVTLGFSAAAKDELEGKL